MPWFIVFLILPASIFIYIENWTFLEGFYYCFVTLSTIGFGDYVAGKNEGPYQWLYKLIVVLWIVFGLAYLSMILNFISQGLRSHHLTNVVHSIRRISGPTFANKSSFQRRRGKLNRQQSFPITYNPKHNGKIITSDLSISSNETPPVTPSTTSYSQQVSFNDSNFSSDFKSQKHDNQKPTGDFIFKFLNVFHHFNSSHKKVNFL